MCSSMKQPKPDRLVEIDGIPITVHSAEGDRNSNAHISMFIVYKSYFIGDFRPNNDNRHSI